MSIFLLCVASRLLALVLWLQHETRQQRGTGPVFATVPALGCSYPLPPRPLCRAPAWLILAPGAPRSSGPLWSRRGGDGCCGWHLCPACCWFTVMMLGTQQGPRVPALATPSQAGDTPHLQAGERRKPSLSSGMCSCFPSGLQSCARAPPALALPLAKCCAIAGLCPRRWGLTGYVFSNPPSGFSPIPARPVLPGAHARTLAFSFLSHV